jgi:hypothetical protein
MRKRKFVAHLFELLLDLGQQANVLLDREPSDKAENASRSSAGSRVALRRMKEFRVHAARHQVAGPARGCAPSNAHKFGIGREQHLCHGVEPGRRRQCQVLDLLAGRQPIGAWAAGAETTPTRRASVFMHVGVPACGQRQAAMVRQPAPSMPTSLGPVMWIRSGWKRSSTSPISGMWRKKRRIEAQVLFEGEGKKAARQLEGPNVAVFDHRPGPVSGAHAKKGKIAPPRKGSKWRLVWATPFTSWNESGKYATRGTGAVISAARLAALARAVTQTPLTPLSRSELVARPGPAAADLSFAPGQAQPAGQQRRRPINCTNASPAP